MRRRPALALPPVFLLLAAIAPAQIAWEKDWDAALARAAAEHKAVFIAVNMDGERANDFLAEKVYREKAVVSLAGNLVCLAASAEEHAGAGRPCKRFPGLTCADHQAIEVRARKEYLRPGPDGAVISPQHLFLKPDGSLLMSVAYEISERELLWCLAEAARQADPETKVAAPAGARPPRRLIMGGVYEVADPTTASRPLSEDELEETIAAIRGGLKGEERVNAFFRVLSTDSQEAIDFITKEMKGAIFGRRVDARLRLIHAVGVYSPPGFWAALEMYLRDPSDTVRNEIAVALEQLAAPKSVKAIRTALAREKDSQVRKNLLRALGSAGAEDKNARKVLLKAAADDGEPFRQVNALIALGSHLADEKAAEVVRAALAGDDPRLAQAAALGLALARAQEWRGEVEAARERQPDEEGKERLGRVLEVLAGANLRTVKEDFVQVAGDRIVRERWFGK
ncbi:MAG: HEAT repeat domain-containing protein [Planctomycetota bacterium]|nr:MAG: HEAT repeat domain-containing protein [Planctomycetota bacterium]